MLGALHGAYGLKGWVRIQPFQDTASLLESKNWQHVLPDGSVQPVKLESVKEHGAGLVAKFEGIDSPEEARALKGAVALNRKDFPIPAKDEYYWVDLIGCEVINEQGDHIGQVKGLIDNGVHDILEVQKENSKVVLIPFIDTYLTKVDCEDKKIFVQWGKDWD